MFGLFWLSACSGGSPEPVVDKSVAPPLDARGLVACNVVDPSALKAARVEPGTATDASNELASRCDWQSADGADSLSLLINVDYNIERIYAAADSIGGSERFEIDGYRAVREGGVDATICTVYVAVGEDQVISAQSGSRSPESPRPCERAGAFAGAVIDALAARSR
ncbi:DUF3558 family protein [Pseudonocardia sp. WMMC193]|uniref:DUF3558 family protein n=1 Tax=Pseudonocardia sp. WMMC193 TaxID=2911965 RepID=UPI001F480BB4|nr:DUF3558 family protein [Pseudonocardia sp. WMMC193]MCF7553322.1 DUF3558 family protein [Pseudonocardia sp. WMMC193]